MERSARPLPSSRSVVLYEDDARNTWGSEHLGHWRQPSSLAAAPSKYVHNSQLSLEQREDLLESFEAMRPVESDEGDGTIRKFITVKELGDVMQRMG
eukprot:COSAG01_NODE_52589_length_345_cov_1.890244_1_plen_96_part_01